MYRVCVKESLSVSLAFAQLLQTGRIGPKLLCADNGETPRGGEAEVLACVFLLTPILIYSVKETHP